MIQQIKCKIIVSLSGQTVLQNRISYKYSEGPKAGKVPSREKMRVQFKTTESRKRAQQTRVVQSSFIAKAGRERAQDPAPCNA